MFLSGLGCYRGDMSALGLAALLGLAVPAGAQGFSEGMTVADMAEGLKAAENLFKQKEALLKRAGILLPRPSS